jgi:hypothetical protein
LPRSQLQFSRWFPFKLSHKHPTAAPAAASTAKPAKHHKKLKTHGKRAAVSEAASAAGTNDKGTPN